jgi:hypothetical protein
LPDCPSETLPMSNPYKVLDHLRNDHCLEIKNPHHVMPFLERYIHTWSKIISERGLDECQLDLSDQRKLPCIKLIVHRS